jgi:hypothetical protein
MENLVPLAVRMQSRLLPFDIGRIGGMKPLPKRRVFWVRLRIRKVADRGMG